MIVTLPSPRQRKIRDSGQQALSGVSGVRSGMNSFPVSYFGPGNILIIAIGRLLDVLCSVPMSESLGVSVVQMFKGR